jgi:DNA-binding beta-propeller fold protein YncE
LQRCLIVLLVSLSAAALAQSAEIRFDGDINVLKLPANIYLGEAAGVALNSKGHIFVYTRSGQTQLFEFDANGTFIRQIGQGLYGFSFAHTVRIDKDDNIWCVDEGTNMVIKFNPEGRVTMVLGRRPEAVEPPPPHVPGAPPPPAREGTFNRPTDIAWDPAGNSYISDGYGNSRVVKIDKDGNWVKAWGQHGSAQGEFNTPHTIATDAKGNVYVGDRGNKRIQVFDTEGRFLREFTTGGAPWAICITPGATQYLYSSDAAPGKIYKLDLDGKLLGELGKNGKQAGQFGWIHEMACVSENVLYVGELLNWRVQKLTLHPR